MKTIKSSINSFEKNVLDLNQLSKIKGGSESGQNKPKTPTGKKSEEEDKKQK